jgi:hypothetical protein
MAHTECGCPPMTLEQMLNPAVLGCFGATKHGNDTDGLTDVEFPNGLKAHQWYVLSQGTITARFREPIAELSNDKPVVVQVYGTEWWRTPR